MGCAWGVVAIIVAGCVALDAVAVAVDEAERRVIEETNALRKAEGRAAQTVNPQLAQVAESFAQFMARTGKYGHSADGRTPADRASAKGYDYCLVLENIAYVFRSRGYPSAAALAREMVQGWKDSPQHRAAMLERDAIETGVGIAQDAQGRYYGVQMFGRPKSAALRFDIRNAAGATVKYQVGERPYALPARTTREHTVCRPVMLTILVPSSPKPVRLSAEAGANYTITDQGVR